MIGDGSNDIFENNTISGNVADAGLRVGGTGGSTEAVGNTIENNRAAHIDIINGHVDNNVIESNTADYEIMTVGAVALNNVSKNKAHKIIVISDSSDDISLNTMEDTLAVATANRGKIVNNTAFSIEKLVDDQGNLPPSTEMTTSNLYTSGDVEMSVVFSGDGRNASLVERTQMPFIDGNNHLQFLPGIGNKKTTYASSIAFSGLDAGEISAITDNVTAVAAGNLRTTAVSAAQAVTVQAQIAALTSALADANAAALAAATVANSAVANITVLTARVNTLTSGFCMLAATVSQPPASLAPLMSLAGCVTVPPAPETISGQDKKDLLALLVLLAIPAAAGVHFASKYRKRLQTEHAARVQAVSPEHADGGGKAQAVDVIVDA